MRWCGWQSSIETRARWRRDFVYAFDVMKDRIELIEIYFKADQEKEDRARIRRYYERVGSD